MSVSTAMEKTRLSLAHCGKVVFAQFTEMLNPCLNRGLPPSAAATDPSLNYYAKGLDIAAAAYVAELNYLANPVSVHCVAAEMMNQSINSLALISARMTGSALDVLSLVRGSSSSYPDWVTDACDTCSSWPPFSFASANVSISEQCRKSLRRPSRKPSWGTYLNVSLYSKCKNKNAPGSQVSSRM